MTDEAQVRTAAPISLVRRHAGRVAAELAIIISGILIALAADALLERRAERVREVELLRLLAADLSESAALLREDSRFAATRSDTLSWYRNLYGQAEESLPTDRVRDVLMSANVTASYAPILRAYEALIATGSLDLIRDDSMLFAIADVNRTTQEYLDYRDQTTNVWLFTLMPIWLEHAGAQNAADLSAALESTQFRGALGQRTVFLRNTARRGNELAARMEQLAERISAALPVEP